MSDIICPRCGRSSRDIEFIEAFCRDCAPVRLECPSRVELEVCTRCGRAKVRGEWTSAGQRKIADLVLSRCKGDFESSSYIEETATAKFDFPSGNKLERTVILDRKKTICQDCSRISGGYFEGIIQIRGDRAKAERLAEALILKLQKATFISKTDEKDEGIDVYIGSSKAVVAVVTEMGLKTLITKKLVGRDQGKRLYRTTFLIRL